ncbi:MAG: DNA mismatch repair endonuclease MutL [Clostridia bacterium]|nr:DNA mismatch repair endonuclease MutL [Clostridia bacterium]
MEDRPIQRLGEELIGKIAAGEVVENPASAIKEMVENSLDSGANCITVEIRDGGISFIRVTDNGRGIRNRDIRMAFERHATSKIATTDDLFHLSTLGFRGEALASIAAVSRMTLTTHRQGEQIGTRAVNEGGVIKEITDAAAPQGTTIVVRDLFYNTPVRLKFLKKPATEASKVAEILQRLILSRPEISLRLISNGKQVYSSSGNGDLRSAVFCLYGRETAENMVQVHAEGSVSIDGLIGVGQEARANRARQTFIINGRSIRSPLLSQALEDGARERFTIGHYPVCVIHMKMPATLVDVNVHPNKLEVRFSDENLIYQKLSQAVHDAFSISPLSGAPEMIHTGDTRPDPVPMQVVGTSPETGTKTAAAIIETTKPVDVKALEASDSEHEKAEPQDAWLAPEKRDELEKNRIVPDIEAVPVTVPPTVPTVPVHTHAEEPVSREPDTSIQDDQNFASVVTNYFGANVREPKPMASAGTERVSETAETSAETRLEAVASIYPERTEHEKPQVQGEQTKFIEFEEMEQQEQEDAFAGYELIGTAFDTYILLQNQKQILMIDQHAAHERILYERLMKEIDLGGGSQLLLVPQIVHVTPQDAVKLETYKDEIASAGYEIEPFGESDYQIRAVPNVLGQPETRAAFLEMIDHLGELRVLTTKQKRRDAILQMACKKAIKGGDKLENAEISALLKEMQRTGAPPTCPHGRPLVVILNRTEIEKKFRRIND